MAEVIGTDEFEEKVINSDKPVLVDFFAAWCGPCKMMSPIIDELGKEMGNEADIYKVDVDASGELANRYQIMSIPTVMVFKDGDVKKQFNGVTQKESLKEALK